MAEETNSVSPRWLAWDLMKKAFVQLTPDVSGGDSREQALARTKLEEAMMWLNKCRAMLGELPKNETHVE